MLLPITSGINKENHMEINGIDFSLLVKKYKTPLYVYDIKTIRAQCREYIKNFNFHSKNPLKLIYRIFRDLLLKQLLLGKDQWYVIGKA